MASVSIEEAQAKLPELIEHLTPGEPLVITRGSQAVAQIISASSDKPLPVYGRGKGKMVVVSEDDEHLEHFKDFMP